MDTSDAGTPLFNRILVGVDGTENALQACRLANRLRAPSGRLLAVAVAETSYAVHAGFQAPEWAWRLRRQALAAHDGVLEEFNDPDIRAEVFDGRAAEKLLDLADEHDADLVAVGRNGGGRSAGLLLGSVATRVVHEARCSVLVADPASVPAVFPQKILVGLDGSETAREAGSLARWLADERGAEVRRLVATGGKPVTSDRAIEAELDPRSPVEALVEESAGCDLVIVGSRGLHGFASLGSVAERVAHAAKCSVLIVRRAPHLDFPTGKVYAHFPARKVSGNWNTP